MAYTRLKMQELDSFRNSSCVFCKQTKSNELLYGKICQYGDIITHYFCMLFSSHMEQNGKDEEGILGFLYNDIKKELIRGRKLICVYCHKDGATINCSNKTCKKRYHLPCAVDNGALHEFFDQFRSFCSQHRPSQAVITTISQEKSICLMCQEDVECKPSPDSIWAPCCKTVWFHRLCVQKMAISAGYFFKCPNCNSKDKFRNKMLKCGIYIPDQDASWELVDNAFRELNERHNQCDVETCKCPHGRAHSATDGKWEIVLCSLCGSQGTHMRCSKEGISSKGLWSCQLCASVVSKMPLTIPTPGPSINTDRRGPRHRRVRRKRNASEEKETPALKSIVIDQMIQDAAKEDTSESTNCLYDNGGQAIHVVQLTSNNCDNVVEIGGVNVIETDASNDTSTNVIALESSDDEEEGNAPPARLSHSSSTNCYRSPPLPTIRRNPPLSPKEPPSLVIDLLDSDDDSPNTNRSSSRLSPINVDDDDEDVVFVGCHRLTKSSIEKEQTPAMIRIIQNNNILLMSATELKRQDSVKPTSAVGSTVNVIASHNNGVSTTSSVMWQSVPRHKSMIHSIPPNRTQTIMSGGHEKNFNHLESNINRTPTPATKEQRWIPKISPNGVPSIRGFETITNNYGCRGAVLFPWNITSSSLPYFDYTLDYKQSHEIPSL